MRAGLGTRVTAERWRWQPRRSSLRRAVLVGSSVLAMAAPLWLTQLDSPATAGPVTTPVASHGPVPTDNPRPSSCPPVPANQGGPGTETQSPTGTALVAASAGIRSRELRVLPSYAPHAATGASGQLVQRRR